MLFTLAGLGRGLISSCLFSLVSWGGPVLGFANCCSFHCLAGYFSGFVGIFTQFFALVLLLLAFVGQALISLLIFYLAFFFTLVSLLLFFGAFI